MAAEFDSMIAAATDALGWTLLDTLWQAPLVVAAYAGARALCHSARARVFVGHCALLLLAVVPLATFALRWPAAPAAGQAGFAATASQWGSDVIAALPASTQVDWLAWLVVAWSIGVAWSSLALLREWWKLRRLCREAEPLDPAWQRRFEVLRERLRVTRRVGLAMSARVVAPLLVGVLRPVVLLPASLVARLPAEQVELILLHELAHLRRLDPWFNLLQAALDTLMFYHPAVHWMSRRLRHDRELCCDDLVVEHGGDRLRYARTLLTLAEHARGMPQAVALAASGGVLLERVERIVERAPKRRALAGLWPLALLVVAGLVASPVAVQRFVGDAAGTLVPLALGTWPGRAERVPPVVRQVFDVEDVALAPMLPRPSVPVIVPDAVDAAPAAALSAPAAPLHAASPEPDPLAGATAAPAIAMPATALPAAIAMPAPAPAAANAAIESAGPPQALAPPIDPLHVTMPTYPRAALVDDVEGWVRLAYGIDAAGRTESIEVLESQPPGVFDTASVRALQRWRFPPEAAGMRRQHQFDFVLQSPAAEDGPRVDRCVRRTGSRLCAAPVASREDEPRLSAD